MEEEETPNVQMICNDCAEKRKKIIQEYIKNNGLKMGDYVRIRLENKKKEAEHIWFVVKENKGKKVIGVLDNYPLYEQDINYGEEKEFDISDIEDVGVFK